ncbi:MAG: (d)CMP kinase [Planctomycetes bacterium]|nr:(d)CMP kinase [Planctomycetota bacterium]
MMPILTVVTLDGPAGAGKSTVAREVARRLAYRFLDTGAMYRTVTWTAHREGIAADDADGLRGLCERLAIGFDDQGRVFAGDEDVSEAIRTRAAKTRVLALAAQPVVRRAMARAQRLLGEEGRLVCEGRDMGTDVFPDAMLRIYLDASPEVRARRRCLELEAKGEVVDEKALLEEIKRRDEADSNRSEAPLRRVAGQILIDSSHLDREDVIKHITSLAQEAMLVHDRE